MPVLYEVKDGMVEHKGDDELCALDCKGWHPVSECPLMAFFDQVDRK